MVGNVLDMMRRIGRRLVWLTRYVCHIQPSDPKEVLFRLNWLQPTSSALKKYYEFPWGKFEYLSAGNLNAQYREIFVQRQYAFECTDSSPIIVDCGGNVGLSVVWFKQQYPSSQVIVYEADPGIADVLSGNVVRLGLPDVTIHPVAVWTSNGTMGFERRGSDVGSLSDDGDLTVTTIRLAECLPERVDLLKLDIEGGEFEVLRDLHETHALQKVDKLIAECHVTGDTISQFIEFLSRVREGGMHFVIGTVYPKRRLHDKQEGTPFPALAGRQFLLELYAWRERTTRDDTSAFSNLDRERKSLVPLMWPC